MSLKLARVHRTLPFHVSKLYRQNSSSSRSLGNAVFRGVVIGGTATGTLAIAGYTIYYFTIKKVVDTVQPALGMLGKSRENLAKQASRPALQYLRAAAKAYVATVPFAGFFVDEAFDAAEEAVDAHSEEATAIIQKAYDDIYRIIKERGNEHHASGSIQIVAAARRLLKELGALGPKSGQILSEQLGSPVSKAVSYASAVSESVKSNAPSAYAGIKNKVHGVFPPKPNSEEEPVQSERQPVSEKSVRGQVADVGAKASTVFESVKSSAPPAFARIRNKVQDIVSQRPNANAKPPQAEPTHKTDSSESNESSDK